MIKAGKGMAKNLESRVSENALVRRVKRTIDRMLFESDAKLFIANLDQIRGLYGKNIKENYASMFREAFDDKQVKKYLSMIPAKDRLAAVEIATRKFAVTPDSDFGDEIMEAITSGSYKKFEKIHTYKPHLRLLRQNVTDTIEEVKQKISEAYREAEDLYNSVCTDTSMQNKQVRAN